MATSMTFSAMNVNAAETAATPEIARNPRSSYYIADKRPSKMDSGKGKFKQIGKSISKTFKKLFRKGDEDEVEETSKMQISGPSNFKHVDSSHFHDQTEDRPGTSESSGSDGWWNQPQAHRYNRDRTKLSVHHAPPTPVKDEEPSSEKVHIAHPPVTNLYGPQTPATPATPFSVASSVGISTSVLDSDGSSTIASSVPGTPAPVPFNVKGIYKKSLANGAVADDTSSNRKTWANNMDGHHPNKNGKRSTFMPRPTNTHLEPKQPRVQSSPPTLPKPARINPHLSGFDDSRKTYVPDDDVEENRNAALEALEGSGADADTADIASTTLTFEEQPCLKDKRPAYVSSYCSDAKDARVYFAANGGIGEAFAPYGSPYPSSDALVADRGSSSTFPSSASTAPSTPALPFTPTDRHSHFFKKIEEDCTLTPAFPSQPANPTSSATPGSAAYLENVYADPPEMPAERDTPKVPVPPRKPVPKQAAAPPIRKSILKQTPAPAVAGPSKLKAQADLYKALPSSPAPHSPRRDTPAPGSHFPPRTDSRNNPVAAAEGMYLQPNAKIVPDTIGNGNGTVPKRRSMNDNAYPIHDAHLSKDFTASPEYLPRGAMNEMEAKERQHALNREASRKAAEAKANYKAKVKAERQAKKEERGAKKLCNMQ